MKRTLQLGTVVFVALCVAGCASIGKATRAIAKDGTVTVSIDKKGEIVIHPDGTVTIRGAENAASISNAVAKIIQ